MTFKTMADVRAANKRIGHNWFDRGAMKFFNTRIESPLIGGKFFVTSEFYEDPHEKKYAVRVVSPDGRVGTVGDQGRFAHKSDAVDEAKAMIAGRRNQVGNRNMARGAVARGKKISRRLKRRVDGTFKPEGKKARPKPPTCWCGAYYYPHAWRGGDCVASPRVMKPRRRR